MCRGHVEAAEVRMVARCIESLLDVQRVYRGSWRACRGVLI